MPNRRFFRGMPTGIVCAMFSILISATPFARALDDWVSDACFAVRGQRATTVKITIISIDDTSLDELQKPAAYLSPELARVIRYSVRQGATAVGLDFFVPASLSELKAIKVNHPDDPTSEHGDGIAVAEAAFDTKCLVVPAYVDSHAFELRRPLEQWQLATAFPEYPSPYGLLNLTTDADLFVRRQQLLFPGESGATSPPALSLALYALSRREEAVSEPGRVQVADRSIPVDTTGRMRINFVSPSGTGAHRAFPIISLRDVLAAEQGGRTMPELEGAIVIIGSCEVGQLDSHPTPFSNGAARLFTSVTPSLMPGPEIHANVIATIHDEAYLIRPLFLEPLPWALVIGTSLGATFARVSLSRGAAVLATALAVLVVSTYVLFRYPGWLLNPVPVTFTAVFTFSAVLARRWWQLRRIFAVVKSEAVVRALEADPRRLDPGGELRVVTVLFADIRDFTTFSERCGDPKHVVTLLNAYFTVVIPGIEAEGGTILAFMGDGLMALFGAPVSQPDHAPRAVRAALAMVRAVRENAALWQQLHFDGLRIGVGVHSGPAVVGAVGSGARKDYTAIGDTINTASRVEGETKHYAAGVLMTAATRNQLASDPELARRCRAIPQPVMLKGRSELVELFQIS